MSRRTLAVAALVLLSACRSPETVYREAAATLSWQLLRVEPRFELAFPLDRSRLELRMVLEARNPSKVRFRAQGLQGRLLLDRQGQSFPVGTLRLDQGLDIGPGAVAEVPVHLSFTQGDLAGSWKALNAALRQEGESLWRLEGSAHLQVMGVGFEVPVRARYAVEAAK